MTYIYKGKVIDLEEVAFNALEESVKNQMKPYKEAEIEVPEEFEKTRNASKKQ